MRFSQNMRFSWISKMLCYLFLLINFLFLWDPLGQVGSIHSPGFTSWFQTNSFFKFLAIDVLNHLLSLPIQVNMATIKSNFIWSKKVDQWPWFFFLFARMFLHFVTIQIQLKYAYVLQHDRRPSAQRRRQKFNTMQKTLYLNNFYRQWPKTMPPVTTAGMFET